MPVDPDAARSPRVAVLTGASAGLGAAIGRELARVGGVSGLMLVARRRDRLEALAEELRTIGPDLDVAVFAADLAEPAAPRAVVERTIDRFGRLDVLINNAGLGLPTLFADAEPELLQRQVAVNFTAPLMLARFAMPSLVERGGAIINIGSAITCVASSALGAYGATKAALAYWNDALRRELDSLGVTVCLVEPGPIGTEFSHAFRGLVEPGGHPHPIVESPSDWMTADVSDVARRVVRLLDHPRRRLSVRRRAVWPFRAMGAVFSLLPGLGDLAVTRVFKVNHDREPRPVL